MTRLTLSAIIIFTFLFPNLQVLAFSGIDGQLIKTADSSAVYLAKGSVRYAFPDQKTYQSWYGNDFSQVQTVSFEELSSYRVAGLVTYKPGFLIKIQTDPKVYEVLDDDGSISWVSSEQEAINKFGLNWASLVRDVPASFFVNYVIVGDTGEGVNLDTGDTTSQCSFEQTPAQPEKEIGLVRVTNNSIGDTSPDIAWSGSNYGIVWVKSTNSANDYYDLYFTTLDSANKVGTKIKIDTTNVESLRPKIIWDGSNYVVVWRGAYKFVEPNGANNETVSLYFAKISANGSIVTPAKTVVGIPADSFVSLADRDQGYAVTWHAPPAGTPDMILNKEIFFVVLDSSGNKISNKIQITSYDESAEYGTTFSAYPEIVWNGSGYGLFWKDRRNDTDLSDGIDNDEIYYASLDESGNKLTGDRRITNADGTLDSLSVIWNGSAYALAFSDLRKGVDYFFNIVNPNGTKQFSSDIQINEAGRASVYIGIAYLNNQYYIAASYIEKDIKKDDGPEMYFFKLDSLGNKIEEKRITYDPWGSRYPSTIVSNTKVGLVWTDSRGQVDSRKCELGNDEIYFVEVK